MKNHKALANQIEAEIQVGKNGVTPGLVEEMHKRLKHHETVKVRVLKNCPLSPEELGEKISQETQSRVITQKGRTVAFFRKKTA